MGIASQLYAEDSVKSASLNSIELSSLITHSCRSSEKTPHVEQIDRNHMVDVIGASSTSKT
eukprot:5055270-Amphidinium_carterae.3